MPTLSDLYSPITSASLDYVAIHPSGVEHPGATPNADGGFWETRAPWCSESLGGVLPAKVGEHRSATNAGTIAQVQALIDGVVVPAVQTALSAELATGAYDATVTRQHIEWVAFVLKPSGCRLSQPSDGQFPVVEARVVMPSTVQGVPRIDRIVQIASGSLPGEAVSSASSLIDNFVVPAIKAETGL